MYEIFSETIPRPLWVIKSDLKDTKALIGMTETLEPNRDHYLGEAAAAFDSGDAGAFEMASRTYDEIAYELPKLRQERKALLAELRANPYWLPTAIGASAVKHMMIESKTISSEPFRFNVVDFDIKNSNKNKII